MVRDIYWLAVRLHRLPDEIRSMSVEDHDYLIEMFSQEMSEASS